VEANVGDDPQHAGLIAVEELHGSFIGIGHQDLRPRPHRQEAMGFIEPLFHHGLRLHHQLPIEDRQQDGEIVR